MEHKQRGVRRAGRWASRIGVLAAAVAIAGPALPASAATVQTTTESFGPGTYTLLVVPGSRVTATIVGGGGQMGVSGSGAAGGLGGEVKSTFVASGTYVLKVGSSGANGGAPDGGQGDMEYINFAGGNGGGSSSLSTSGGTLVAIAGGGGGGEGLGPQGVGGDAGGAAGQPGAAGEQCASGGCGQGGGGGGGGTQSAGGAGGTPGVSTTGVLGNPGANGGQTSGGYGGASVAGGGAAGYWGGGGGGGAPLFATGGAAGGGGGGSSFGGTFVGANNPGDGFIVLSIKGSAYAETVDAAAPFAYWRLGERAGSTRAADASGHGNAGHYYNNPTFGVTGAVQGDGSTAVTFGGSSYMLWQPPGSLSGTFTVEAWVKPPSDLTGQHTFIDSRTPSAEFGFDVKLNAGQLYTDIGDGVGQWLWSGGVGYSLRSGIWYQVAEVVQPQSFTIYVDGQAVATKSLASGGTPLLYNSNHPVVVGADLRFPTEQFNGSVGEVAIFDHALTATQLTDQYHIALGAQARLIGSRLEHR
jgi:hypothetical protein